MKQQSLGNPVAEEAADPAPLTQSTGASLPGGCAALVTAETESGELTGGKDWMLQREAGAQIASEQPTAVLDEIQQGQRSKGTLCPSRSQGREIGRPRNCRAIGTRFSGIYLTR
jgi:hypothetical protein